MSRSTARSRELFVHASKCSERSESARDYLRILLAENPVELYNVVGRTGVGADVLTRIEVDYYSTLYAQNRRETTVEFVDLPLVIRGLLAQQ